MADKTICAECVEIHKSMMENAHKAGLLRAAEIAKKMPMDLTLGELNGLERNAFYMSSCKIAEAIRKEANESTD